jgi:hypothetical protein
VTETARQGAGQERLEMSQTSSSPGTESFNSSLRSLNHCRCPESKVFPQQAAQTATMSAAHAAGATSLTQGSENFGYSAVRLRRIRRLQFGIIDPAELVRYVPLLSAVD